MTQVAASAWVFYFHAMINWRSTTIHHEVRRAIGITNDEYCLLDWIYHTQGSDIYGRDGWCEIPYKDIADTLGVSKGGAFQMVDRMERRGFIEVNPANPKQKRVTGKFSLPVYFNVSHDEEVGATIVQKVNDERPFVQKVNASVQKVNDERSLSERQIKVNTKSNLKETTTTTPAKNFEIVRDESEMVSDSETQNPSSSLAGEKEIDEVDPLAPQNGIQYFATEAKQKLLSWYNDTALMEEASLAGRQDIPLAAMKDLLFRFTTSPRLAGYASSSKTFLDLREKFLFWIKGERVDMRKIWIDPVELHAALTEKARENQFVPALDKFQGIIDKYRVLNTSSGTALLPLNADEFATLLVKVNGWDNFQKVFKYMASRRDVSWENKRQFEAFKDALKKYIGEFGSLEKKA